MSWSIQFIGKPDKVVTALQEQSGKLTGESKVEYDSALPHLVGLVNENHGADILIKLAAAGHGYISGETPVRQLTASIELIYGLLV